MSISHFFKWGNLLQTTRDDILAAWCEGASRWQIDEIRWFASD